MDGQTKLDSRLDRMGPVKSGEGYESWRWIYWLGEDNVGDQSIKNEPAISKAVAIHEAIEIVISDQVCDRGQGGAKYTMLPAVSTATAIRN